MKDDFLKLNDIVEKATNGTISLPTVQRGFVWKPHQIENLWDSLLRGYPIGSFVLSNKQSSEKGEFELLDGQQRASAICLGFYTPLVKKGDDGEFINKIFKTSYQNIIVYIDLLKPDQNTDNRKYLFRVITKSHPWGYRRQDNHKTLESRNISKAMSYYKISNYDYLRKPLKEFWPFDSYEPIPLGLFIHATSIEDLKISIRNWKKELDINNEEQLQVLGKRDEENISFYSLEEIYEAVKKMLKKQKIPLLFLNLSEIYDEETTVTKIPSNKNEENVSLDVEIANKVVAEPGKANIEDRNVDEIENLFIRLNSGGTNLLGEELNYSILKSHIKASLQEKIEDACKGLFNPARFITIAFRLFNNIPEQKNALEYDTIGLKIKPKQFQRFMKESKKDDFIKFIEQFIDSSTLRRTQEILLYSPTNTIGLPVFIVSSLASRAPEIMFMLLYRIHIKKDIITPDVKVTVLGIITLFTWLGQAKKQRDHSKLLKNIWPGVKNLPEKLFWSKYTVQRGMLEDYNGNDILTEFPSLNKLKKLVAPQLNITTLTWAKFYETEFGDFINTMFYNKDLILYAQRTSLSEWFHEIEQFDLDDTNRAFDWDHIVPSSYIENKKNVNQALRDWHYSNGNLRAWQYSLNRADHDDAPSDKLNPKGQENLVWWSNCLKKKYGTENDLRDDLIKLSFCEKDWLTLNNDIRLNIKDNNVAKRIIYCILNRNVNLCIEWYEHLEINKLIASSPNVKDIKGLFESVINRTMWTGIKDSEDKDRYVYTLPIGENDLYLYLSFIINNNTLKEGEVYFRVYQENNQNELGKIKIPTEKSERYYNDYNYIASQFTLISFSGNSIIELFEEFKVWLEEFPENKIKNLALKKFNNSIKKNPGAKYLV